MLIPVIIPSLALYGQGLHPKGIACFLPQDLGREGKAGEQPPHGWATQTRVPHVHPATSPRPLHPQMCAETVTHMHTCSSCDDADFRYICTSAHRIGEEGWVACTPREP